MLEDSIRKFAEENAPRALALARENKFKGMVMIPAMCNGVPGSFVYNSDLNEIVGYEYTVGKGDCYSFAGMKNTGYFDETETRMIKL